MYEYIKGKLADLYDDQVIIESYGIGYAIRISTNTLTQLGKINDEIKLYIHEHIREDEMTFYGFYDKNEREIFCNLISISGIGPRVSLGILSKFKVGQLLQYISIGDEKALSSVPGIGKKTANRIILELKDKFKSLSEQQEGNVHYGVDKINSTPRIEAIEALTSLGYTYAESMQLMSKVYKPELSLPLSRRHTKYYGE
ncbi:MAG: Holliday junction branch migration protein RuvA [Eubacteriales bacterium]